VRGLSGEFPLRIRPIYAGDSALQRTIDSVFDNAPDWFQHPAYAELLSAGERLSELRAMAPAARPASELGQLDPARLSDTERIDLVTLIAEQRNWLAALEARVLAEIDGADESELGLAQEEVSLALKLPPRTAQHRLKTAVTLTRDLPNTFGLLTRGAISYRTRRSSSGRPGGCPMRYCPTSKRHWPAGLPTRRWPSCSAPPGEQSCDSARPTRRYGIDRRWQTRRCGWCRARTAWSGCRSCSGRPGQRRVGLSPAQPLQGRHRLAVSARTGLRLPVDHTIRPRLHRPPTRTLAGHDREWPVNQWIIDRPRVVRSDGRLGARRECALVD